MVRPISMRSNVLANLAGRGWSMLSGFLFVPFYVRLLGSEAYGLISFAVTLQVVLTVAVTGWTKALRREFASEDPANATSVWVRRYALIRSFEFVYLLLAVLLVLFVYWTSPWIVYRFLEIGGLDPEIVVTSIRLMGASIGLQLLFSSYTGCLFALQRQVEANILEISWSFLRNVGVVLLLSIVGGGLLAFFTWWVVVDTIYLVTLRLRVLSTLRHQGGAAEGWRFGDVRVVAPLWRMSLGLTVVSIVYVVNTQTDRAIISGTLGLVELGAYNLAYSLGQVAVAGTAALATAALPAFTKAYTRGDQSEARRLYGRYSWASILGVSSVATFMVVFAGPILYAWTQDDELSGLAAPAAPFVIAGSALLALQQVPYEFLISRGITWVNVAMSLVSVPYVLFVTPWAIGHMGLVGAGVAWCALMVASTLFYVGFVGRFAGETLWRSLGLRLVVPLLCSGLVAVGVWIVAEMLTSTPLAKVGVGVGGGLMVLGLSVAILRRQATGR